MEERRETFMPGAPEVYFDKPILRRQRVRARHRQNHLQPTKVGNKITTNRRRGVLAGLWHRWLSWFPTPLGGRI